MLQRLAEKVRKSSIRARILAGFFLIVVTFAGASLVAVEQMHRIREDLRLVHGGYLALTRLVTQVRAHQELKDDALKRAVAEPDAQARRPLLTYAQSFYPRVIRDRLQKATALAQSLRNQGLSPQDDAFMRGVIEQVQQASTRHDETNRAAAAVLAAISTPDAPEPPTAPEPPNDAGDEGDPSAVDGGPSLDGGQSAQDTSAAATNLERTLEDDVLGRGKIPPEIVAEYRGATERFSREVSALSLKLEGKIAGAILQAERNERDAYERVVLLSLLALGVGAGILLAINRAMRPIRLLLESARALARGSRNVVVEIDSHDEIGALATEFNSMARALGEREQAVARQNDDLKRLKNFSDDVIRSVRVGIVVVDEEGRVRAANPAARSVFRLALVDVEGRPLRDLQLPDPLPTLLDALEQAQETGEVAMFPLQKIGDKIVDVSLIPVRDKSGVSSRDVLLLGEDVTAREETRERLVQSERLAAIGRLAAQITHEIRNPLSSVALNIDLLGDDVSSLPPARQEEAAAILKAVGDEVDRLTQITEGYLRFARLPAPSQVPGDVGDVLADLAAFSQGEAASKGVMVELAVDDQLPPIAFDGARLRQALLNLLLNAFEAAQKGGTVRLKAMATKTGARLSVEDTGPGVPEDIREQLFEPFFTTKENGTGLGLTLTREVVMEHGGELHVDKSPLGGAAFHIDLVATKAPSEAAPLFMDDDDDDRDRTRP